MIALIEQKRESLVDLCRRYRVSRLEVFGSAVTGKFDPERSDLDVLVEFERSSPMFRMALPCVFGLVGADLPGTHSEVSDGLCFAFTYCYGARAWDRQRRSSTPARLSTWWPSFSPPVFSVGTGRDTGGRGRRLQRHHRPGDAPDLPQRGGGPRDRHESDTRLLA